MAIAYSTAAAQARMAACYTATGTAAGQSVDGQSGDGLLVIGTSALSGATGVLCTVTLQKPSFTQSGKTETLNGVPISATPSASGTAALAELRDSAGNTVVSGLTVGTSGTNIVLSTTALTTTIPVQITSGTITSS